MDWSTAGHAIQVVFDDLFLRQNPICSENTTASDLIDQMLQLGCRAGGDDRENRGIASAENKEGFVPPLASLASDTKQVCPNDAKTSDLPSTNSKTGFNRATKLSLSKPKRNQVQDINGKKNPVCIEKPKPSKTDNTENEDSSSTQCPPKILNHFSGMTRQLQKSNGTAASVEDLKLISCGDRKTIALAWGTNGLLIQEAFDEMFNHVTKNTASGEQNSNFETSNEKPERCYLELIKTKSNTKDNIGQQLGVDSDIPYSCDSADRVGEYGSPYTDKVSPGDSTIPEKSGEAACEKHLSPYGDDIAISCVTNDASLVTREPEHPSVLPPVQIKSVNAVVDNNSSDSLSLRGRIRPRRNIQPVDRIDNCPADQVSVIDCAADVSCYSDRLRQSDHVSAKSRVSHADAVADSLCLTRKVKMAADSTNDKAQVVQKVGKPECLGQCTEHTQINLPKNKIANRTNKKQAQNLRKNISKSRNATGSVKKCVGKKSDKCSSCEEERKKGRNKKLTSTRDISGTSFDGRQVNWNSRIQKQTLSYGKNRGCYKKPTTLSRETVLTSSCNDAKKPKTIRNVPVGDKKSAKVKRQSKPASSRYIAKEQTRTCNIPATDMKPVRVTRYSQLPSRYHAKKQTRTQIIPSTETATKRSRSTNSQVTLKFSKKTKKSRSFKSSQQVHFKRPKKITLIESKNDRIKRKEVFKRSNKLTPPESRKEIIKQKEQLKRPQMKTMTENKKDRYFKRPHKREKKSKIILLQESNKETNSISLINGVRPEKQSFGKAEYPVKLNNADLPAFLTAPSESNEQVLDWLSSCPSGNTAEQNGSPDVSTDHQLDYGLTPVYPATSRLFGLDNLQSYLRGCNDASRPSVDLQNHMVMSQGIGSLFSSSGHAGEIWKSIV